MHLQPVLDTLVYLKHETKVWFEITTLLIPEKNDSADEARAMSKWIFRELGPDVPLHFTAFHPDYRMLEKPHTPPATLAMARRIALEHGLRYAYVGNVHDLGRQSTFCHQCGSCLIERDWYVGPLGADAQGRCGTPCAGVFEARPANGDRSGFPLGLPISTSRALSPRSSDQWPVSSAPKLSATNW